MKILRIISLMVLLVFAYMMLSAVQILYPSLNAVQPPVPTGTNSTHYATVQQLKDRHMTGQTVIIGLGNSANSPLVIDQEGDSTANTACAPSINFTTADAVIALYVTNKIFSPVTEGGSNTWTPKCVWSQAQANASNSPYLQSTAYIPGDYILVSGTYWVAGCPTTATFDSSCLTASTPATFSGSTVTDGNVTWTNNGANAPVLSGFCGTNYKCGPAGSSCFDSVGTTVININTVVGIGCTVAQLYQSEAIPWQPPLRAWMKSVLTSVYTHYAGSPGYVRVGFAGGETSPIGIDSGLWPNYGSTHNQRRAQYLTYVKSLYDFIASLPAPTLQMGDLNCAGNPTDCTFADQEAQLLHDHNFGQGTNGYGIADIANMMGVGATNCTYNPMTAAQGCTTGDWLYNCTRFTTMSNGNPMPCLLQTVSSSTPLGCVSGTAGPLAPLPVGSTNCPAGSVGLLPFLVTLRTTGVPGISPAVIANVSITEIYVNGPLTCTPNIATCVANGTYGVGDILLALDPNYTSSQNGQVTYAVQANAYLQAFAQYLGIVPRLTLTGVGE